MLLGTRSQSVAAVGGWLAADLLDVTDDLTALDGEGWWAVVLPYDGAPVCARFARVRPLPPTWALARGWGGPGAASWRSSLDRAAWRDAVAAVRSAIARGDVYQVNLTRRLTAPQPEGGDVVALGRALAAVHPAPHAATIRLPTAGVHIASASPELFLRVDGKRVVTRPIKGTAPSPDAFLAKDRAENVMIVDLARNDLGRVCEVGSVTVTGLCDLEHHPGLTHMVSTVQGRLRHGVGWAELLSATFPPASVTGAPKLAAVEQIARLEPIERGPYCGALGYVDADAGVGALNVAIRTFWLADGLLCFGTGGAITWDSDPDAEWRETELKAAALLAAAGRPGAVTAVNGRANR